MADKGLVLVTGASGFVGKWCVVRLLERGYPVRGTVRSKAKAEQVRATVAAVAGSEAADRLDLVEADLLDDKGWAEAMRGVSAVMHVATAIRADEPKDQSLVIRPAMEGTARALRFAHEAGIKRVILTCSVATVGYGHGQTSGKRVYDESYTTNLDNMKYKWAYCIGKTRAEKAAWDYARRNGIGLTTIHPGAILGPALDDDASISIGMVTSLLGGELPMMPSNGFAVVDVRDVADLHVAALENPASAGERYLATAEYTPFPKVAEILRELYPDHKVTLRVAPDWIIRLSALIGGPTRQIINDIGNEKHYDTKKSEALLGRKYISARDAILASAESAFKLGLIGRDMLKG
jgi:dihydroflavonol-4-reductase